MMKGHLKILTIVVFTFSSSVGFGYASGDEDISTGNSREATLAWIHNNCDNMSPPLAVDEYMKCVENGGRLGFRDFRIQLKNHPVLARSDCHQIIDEQRFMNCLDAYIRNRGLSANQPANDGSVSDQPERVAGARDVSR